MTKLLNKVVLTFIPFRELAEALTSSVDLPAIKTTNSRAETLPPPPAAPVALPDDAPPAPPAPADELPAEPDDPSAKSDDLQVDKAAPAEQPPLACFTPITAPSTSAKEEN